MTKALAGSLVAALLTACVTSPEQAKIAPPLGNAGGKPLTATVSLSPPSDPATAARFNVSEDNLWRIHVVNASDHQIMGMMLDGLQIWFDSPFTRTCTATPPDACASDEGSQRAILIQSCRQVQQNVALVYRDSRDSQVYRSSAVSLSPKCDTRGALIMFR
jgi:hypothetical protein